MSKFRLWLLAHGIEFEGGKPDTFPIYPNKGNVYRHIGIVINHRYFGVDVMILPFKGVFTDELDKSHAAIAAEVASFDD